MGTIMVCPWIFYGVSEEAAARGCEIVCFGHTHKPVVEKKNGVLVINPGSLSFSETGRPQTKLCGDGAV